VGRDGFRGNPAGITGCGGVVGRLAPPTSVVFLRTHGTARDPIGMLSLRARQTPEVGAAEIRNGGSTRHADGRRQPTHEHNDNTRADTSAGSKLPTTHTKEGPSIPDLRTAPLLRAAQICTIQCSSNRARGRRGKTPPAGEWPPAIPERSAPWHRSSETR
jgi:hypothetical protein